VDELEEFTTRREKVPRQHGIGPYITDFYCPECRVIVELDGAAHQGVLAGERNAARDQYLTNLGFNVLRFENRAVFDNLEFVLETNRAALKSSRPQPRRGGCAK
jgi:very-short-patch-repair endonuclease